MQEEREQEKGNKYKGNSFFTIINEKGYIFKLSVNEMHLRFEKYRKDDNDDWLLEKRADYEKIRDEGQLTEVSQMKFEENFKEKRSWGKEQYVVYRKKRYINENKYIVYWRLEKRTWRNGNRFLKLESEIIGYYKKGSIS